MLPRYCPPDVPSTSLKLQNYLTKTIMELETWILITPKFNYSIAILNRTCTIIRDYGLTNHPFDMSLDESIESN